MNQNYTLSIAVTPQRIAILKEIESNGHIGIEEVYEKIKKKYPSTSLATVYKNIATLCGTAILREVKAPGHKQKFELSQDKHVHVMCERCGKLEDLHVDFSSLQHNCMQISGYNLYDVSAVFLGTCPRCLRQNTTNNETIKQSHHQPIIKDFA